MNKRLLNVHRFIVDQFFKLRNKKTLLFTYVYNYVMNDSSFNFFLTLETSTQTFKWVTLVLTNTSLLFFRKKCLLY